MLTQVAAGRVYDFSHVVGRGTNAGEGFRLPVAIASNDGNVFYVLNRGMEHFADVPWNRTQAYVRVSKVAIGMVPGDEEMVFEFSQAGDDSGELIWPAGITLDQDQNVYVTDEWLNRVTVFDKDGKFQYQWGSGGRGDGELNAPSGIVADNENDLFIVDSRNHRVQKFTKDGRFLAKWGTFGASEGQFDTPWGITLDHDGAVYVADHKNNRVQKFSPQGEFVAQFGSYGSGNGQLNRPSDVAVDPDGDVYVCDWANNRVQVFGQDSKHVTSLLGDAQELSKWAKIALEANPIAVRRRRETRNLEREWLFALPTGLLFDAKHGRLIVADTQRARLQIYNKLLDYPQPSINV
jgi:DNA-binding beta-propeller fold protein YncE